LRLSLVGATSTYHQTAAGVALLARFKRAQPKVITAMGGANCEDEMAEGIASLGAPIDYVFSGDCEETFPDFLRGAVTGQPLPADHIVSGKPYRDLDSLPEPSFEDYFAQLDNALPSCKDKEIWLPYATSRGCWWGAHQHCTFCGLNDETMFFRQKSPERVIAGAKRLLLRYPTRRLSMIDNILPHSYFRTVLPRLAEELPSVQIFYEAKSNMNLEQVDLLRRAGVVQIQPGIEALSSSLLRRMKKGVLARQNLALLRYARATGLGVAWNMLYGFPGDQPEDYDSILALMPLIHHLPPPTGLYFLSMDRFSPYVRDPAAYSVTALEPAPGYASTFPPTANLRRLAYQFTGKYDCANSAHPELYDSLDGACREWRASWRPSSPAPALSLAVGDDGYYSLMDTRNLEGTEMFRFVNEEEARAALIGHPLHQQPLAEWAIERKLAVAIDGWCLPLAVTNVDTWRRLETRSVNQSIPATV
jgi:ribosomal peptide maturation radical SAM protein 1